MSELEHGSMVDLAAARGRNATRVRRRVKAAAGRTAGILWITAPGDTLPRFCSNVTNISKKILFFYVLSPAGSAPSFLLTLLVLSLCMCV